MDKITQTAFLYKEWEAARAKTEARIVQQVNNLPAPKWKSGLKWLGKPKLEFANRHHLFKREPLHLTRHDLIRKLVDSVENGTG